MDIEAYLDRIRYRGPRDPSLETLKGVHHAHAMTVPWENLDVQFGRSLTPDVTAAYAKIVERGRGGWCYEQNGLLGWALGELGFKVRRFIAGGMPDGVRMVGNHLAIRVDLDGEAWIADVGGGDTPSDPVRLREGPVEARGFSYRVEQLSDGWWRVHNHPLGILPFTDHNPELQDEDLLADRSRWLSNDPASVFVLNAVAIAQWPTSQCSLRGRLFAETADGDQTRRLIKDAEDYVATLKAKFRLDLPEAAQLWPKICARHEQVVAENARPKDINQ